MVEREEKEAGFVTGEGNLENGIQEKDGKEGDGKTTEGQEPEKMANDKKAYDKKVNGRKANDRAYYRRDFVLALMIILASWMYTRGSEVFPGTWLPLFTALFAWAGVYYMASLGRKMDREGKAYLVFLLLAGAWFLVKYIPGLWSFEDQGIMPYMVLFLHGTGVYWLLTISGARRRSQLDESAFLELGRGFFAIPFTNFGEIFLVAAGAVRRLRHGEPRQGERRKDRAGQIVFGIAMAIPVLTIVLPMLAAADESFSAFTSGLATLFRSVDDWIFAIFRFGSFIQNTFLILGACYFFGLFYGAFHMKNVKAEENGKNEALYRLPFTVILSFSAAVCGVYALFFMVKLSDTMLKGISMQPFVYSDYARQGFFELCYIAVINFGLFYFIKVCSDREKRGIKIILSLLCAETLGFILLAFSKMSLYISVYGFTFKRVFTSWFMAVLFVTFSRLLYQIRKEGNAIGPAVLFASVTFLLLAYSNMDEWMYQVNLMMGFL